MKVKLHSDLPYAEGEEFLEGLSLDRGAGVLPVQEGGCSSSDGPAVPEDVEESALVKKLAAPSAPNSGGPGRAHRQRACGVQDLVS